MQEKQVVNNNTYMLQQFVKNNHVRIINSFLSFLDHTEISILASFSKQSQRKERIFIIAHAKHFINHYLNRLDRANYFLFYDQSAFKKIQQHQITHIALQQPQKITYHHTQIDKIITNLTQQLKQLSLHQELKAIIDNIFFQTDLPLPKMKRETIGIHCQTVFQDYLALLRFSDDIIEQPWVEDAVLELKESIQIQLENKLTNFPYEHYPTSSVHQIIKIIRFTGYKVDSFYKQKWQIKGFKTHNLIVLLLALCSQLVDCYSFILQKYTDPFMRFTEFVLRSNVYRNIVLSIQQKFSFLFTAYSRFYQHVYSSSSKPAFSFWRAALSIWLQKMKIYHNKNSRIFSYISIRLRQKFLYDFLLIKTQKMPSFFTTIKDQMFLKIFSQSRKQSVYEQQNSKIELQQFFQSNAELYQVILKDYLQYMVDISINQFNVHKCGHSQHTISNSPLFNQFQQALISQSIYFYEFCRQILYDSVPKEIRLGMLREVLKEDLQIMNEKICKAVIMKNLLRKVNQMISQQIDLMPEYMIFSEEGYEKYKINWDFEQKDSLLDYFCNKYDIKQCQKSLQFYYNLQIQAKSEQGSIESDCQQQMDYEQYLSQQQPDKKNQFNE